jgi:rare lipoprotein A
MMMKRTLSTLLFSIILPFFCFAQSIPLNFFQIGVATQEIESDDRVAGHPILPIGQEVSVTNLNTSAQTTVTITGRIPQSSGRIIDLSSGAAAALAMFDITTQVAIEAQLKPTAPAAVAPPPAAVAPPPVPAATPTVAPVPAAASQPVTTVPSAQPTRQVLTSAIESIVPPWEIGSRVIWPMPSAKLMTGIPELSNYPWIGAPTPQKPKLPVPPPARATGPAAKLVPAIMPGPESQFLLFRVQLGAFKTQQNAQEIFNRLLYAGFHPVFERQGNLIRVSIPWVRGSELTNLAQWLYTLGFREAWIREE